MSFLKKKITITFLRGTLYVRFIWKLIYHFTVLIQYSYISKGMFLSRKEPFTLLLLSQINYPLTYCNNIFSFILYHDLNIKKVQNSLSNHLFELGTILSRKEGTCMSTKRTSYHIFYCCYLYMLNYPLIHCNNMSSVRPAIATNISHIVLCPSGFAIIYFTL